MGIRPRRVALTDTRATWRSIRIRKIITATDVTAGNTGDAEPAKGLLADELTTGTSKSEPPMDGAVDGDDALPQDGGGAANGGGAGEPGPLSVYGDAAYGAGALLVDLEAAGAQVMVKVQPPAGQGGRYPKDRFLIDPGAGTVTCPAKNTVSIRPVKDGGGTASFGAACATCPLAAACTTAKSGRSITISPYEEELVRARTLQREPGWRAEYRATRPKVERKIGHLMRRKHGGRRARVRGRTKVDADFSLLAAAVNIARFGMLGISRIMPSRPVGFPV